MLNRVVNKLRKLQSRTGESLNPWRLNIVPVNIHIILSLPFLHLVADINEYEEKEVGCFGRLRAAAGENVVKMLTDAPPCRLVSALEWKVPVPSTTQLFLSHAPPGQVEKCSRSKLLVSLLDNIQVV